MFPTHKLNDKGFKAVKEFKESLSKVLSLQLEKLQDGRDKSICITKFEEAVFFGTRAIASDPLNYTEIINYTEVSGSVIKPLDSSEVFKIGDKVLVSDRYRLAAPALATVKELSTKDGNNGINVSILPNQHGGANQAADKWPEFWVHKNQLKKQ